MTADFIQVRPDTPVRGAHALMRSSNMRDLVVMDGDRLAGVICQLDLYLIQSLTDADPESAVVEEAMTSHPYVVAPDVSLEQVARTMWTERYGSAVVVQDDRVVGIFTIADSLRALSQVLSADSDDGQTEAPTIEVNPTLG
jgi:acetoin utilization protein AcuB